MNLPIFDMRKWVLMIAIAIVFNLFINYGLNTVYKSPEINDYCNGTEQYPRYAYPMEKFPYGNVNVNVSCPEIPFNGTMERDCAQAGGTVQFNYDDKRCPTDSYCEMCYKYFDDVMRSYDANVFLVLVAVGSAILILGIFVTVESVGGGLLLAGILSIIIAAFRSWANLHEYVRLLFLGLALALLIFVGYKKIR